MEDAKGIAESLHDFLGSAKRGGNDTGEKAKSKLELRVEKLEPGASEEEDPEKPGI